MPHELVHAIVFPNQPVRFFAEALAVALGGDDGNPDSSPYSFSPDQLLQDEGAGVPPTAFYGIAGDFGSYLIDRFGALEFAQLNPLITRGTSPVAVDSAFASIYGQTISSSFEDRRISSKRYAGARLGFPECNVATTPWTAAGWSASAIVDCSIDGITSSDDPTGATAYVTAEVPVSGVYRISLAGDGSSKRFSIQRCVSGEQFDYFPTAQPDLTHTIISGSAPVVFAWLSQGRHFLRYVGQRSSPSTFAASIRPTTDAADHCLPSTTVIDASSDGVFAVTPWDGPTVVVPFTVSVDRPARAVLRDASLAVCDGNCDTSGTACNPLSSGDSVMLAVGHTYSLVAKGSTHHSFAGLAFVP